VGLLAALWQALEVSRRETRALDAAIAAGKAGGSPLAVLRAFSAASGGQLEAWALAELEAGLRQAVTLLHQVAIVAAASQWLAPEVRAVVDRLADGLLDAGYDAAGWAARLRTWLEEGTP